MVEEGAAAMMSRSFRKLSLFASGLALCLFLLYRSQLPCQEYGGRGAVVVPQEVAMTGSDQKTYVYDRSMPIIFIGGVPRSGTTLMRSMLDAHPDVRCGEETRVIPRLLQMRAQWMNSQKESLRLKEAGLTKEVLDSAVASFILEVVAKHGEPAPRLCNKDPFTLRSALYLSYMFPTSKYIFMVRDGRATVHSIISRKVTITGFDLTSYRQCLTKWNSAVQNMYNQCSEVGSDRCLMVYYEQLVLHPRSTMERVLEFLDLPWNETVLHHEEMINKPGGVSLSKLERSSDQVVKPVNLEALSKWVEHMPEDVVQDMPQLAPMLSKLGYNPYANPPKYGDPDMLVAKNTRLIQESETKWKMAAQQVLNFSKQEVQQQNAPPTVRGS